MVCLPLEENAKNKEEEILVGRVWLLGLRGPVVGSFGFRSGSGSPEAAKEANLYPGPSLRTKEPVSPVATGNGREELPKPRRVPEMGRRQRCLLVHLTCEWPGPVSPPF